MADVDLACLSRFETPESIERIGSWAAVNNPSSLFAEAFRRVSPDRCFPLLCVVDVVLKFSKCAEREISNLVPNWLMKMPRPAEEAAANAAEALVLAWIEFGVVSTICNTAFPRRNELFDTADRVFPCSICRLRFSDVTDCTRHTKMHNEAAKYARQKQGFYGLFATFEEKRKIEAAQKMQTPRRAASPVRIKPTDLLVHAQACAVCGDSLKKAFSDPHNDFMWDGVVRCADDTLLHDECATLFFESCL